MDSWTRVTLTSNAIVSEQHYDPPHKVSRPCGDFCIRLFYYPVISRDAITSSLSKHREGGHGGPPLHAEPLFVDQLD